MKKQKSKNSKRPKVIEKVFVAQPYDPNIGQVFGVSQPEEYLDTIDAYRIHPWVYSSVFAIATNFAQVEYRILMVKNKEEIEDMKHPFKVLLENPNPFISSYQLKEWTAISLELTGDSYWKLERDNRGNIYEIWPIPSSMIRPIVSKENFVSHFVYQVDGKTIQFRYEDVIHFQYTNPLSFLYGQGSALASRRELLGDLAAETWNRTFFNNSARPDSILETEKVLNEADRARLLSAWKKVHQGTKKSHRVAILSNGLKYKETGRSQKDMDFVSQRKMSRESIISTFGVPPAKVGLLEYANYANIKEQNKIFWNDKMLPMIRLFSSTLTMRVAQITFRPTSFFRPNLEQIEALRPDEKLRADTAKIYVDMGIPLNQVIEHLDLPFDEVEGGDISRPASSGLNLSNSTEPKSVEQKTIVQQTVQKEKIAGNKATADDIEWKDFDEKLREHEGRFERVTRVFFRAQQRRVISKFKEIADEFLTGKVSDSDKGFLLRLVERFRLKQTNVEISLVFDEELEDNFFKIAVDKPLKNALKVFATDAGRRFKDDFNFNIDDPKIKNWLDNKSFKLVREANAFTKESISDEIVEAIENAVSSGFSKDETIKEIVDRINEVYEFAAEGRAERIARTEVLGAANKGNYEGWKEVGVEKKKWLSSRDGKVRDTHQERNIPETVVGINEPFMIGDSALMFPGDPSGPAGEIINCRCTLSPISS